MLYVIPDYLGWKLTQQSEPQDVVAVTISATAEVLLDTPEELFTEEGNLRSRYVSLSPFDHEDEEPYALLAHLSNEEILKNLLIRFALLAS